MEITEDTQSFIQRLKLPVKYVDLLIQNGYHIVCDLVRIDGERLKEIGITLPGHRRRIMNSLRNVLPSSSKKDEESKPITQLPEDVYSFSNYHSQPDMKELHKEEELDSRFTRVDTMYGAVNYNFDPHRTWDSLPDIGYDSSKQSDQTELKNLNEMSHGRQSDGYPSPVATSPYSVYDCPSSFRLLEEAKPEDVYQYPVSQQRRSHSTLEVRRQSQDSNLSSSFGDEESVVVKSLPPPLKPNFMPDGQRENNALLHPDVLYDTVRLSHSESALNEIESKSNQISLIKNYPKPVPRKRTPTPPDLTNVHPTAQMIKVLNTQTPNLAGLKADLQSEIMKKMHNYENVPLFLEENLQEKSLYKSDSDIAKEQTASSTYEEYYPNLKNKLESMEDNSKHSAAYTPPQQSDFEINQSLLEPYATDQSDEFGIYKKLRSPQLPIQTGEPFSYKNHDDEYNLLDRRQNTPSPKSPSMIQMEKTEDRQDEYDVLGRPSKFIAKQSVAPITQLDKLRDKPTYQDQHDEYNLLDRSRVSPQFSLDEQDLESVYDYPPSFSNHSSKSFTQNDGIYHDSSLDLESVTENKDIAEDQYESTDDLGIKVLPKQVTPQEYEENEYEDTNFAVSVLTSKTERSLPGRSVSPRNHDNNSEQVPSTNRPPHSANMQNDPERRVSRSRAGGISFYGGFKEFSDFKPRQKMKRMLRSGREKKQERPVSVCMQSDNALSQTDDRTRTHSSTLNRKDYSFSAMTKKSDKNSDAYKKFVTSLDQPPMIPVSPLKKTRTKSGWLWKQPLSESKVPPRKRWAVYDGNELIYYINDTKIDFSKGVLPVEMMLKLEVPSDSQTSFHLRMKGGKTFIFLTESKEERVIWTSTLMAAILTFQKEPSHQIQPGGDMESPYKEGDLKMDGVKRKVYVALKNDIATYYKNKKDFMFAQPVTRIRMKTASMRDVGRFKFQLVFPSKVFGFAAESDEEKMSWMEAFQMAISGRLSNQQCDGSSSKPLRQSTSLRDHLFKYGGDFKYTTDNRKMRNKLQLIKSALQTGDFQKRMCTLECAVLSYCDSEKPFAVKDSFSCSELLSVTIYTPDIASKSGFQHCFELSRKSGRTYLFCAEKKETRMRWTTGIAREILPDNAQDLLPIEEFDKVGKVKLKVEPLSVMDSIWKDTWCCLYQKKLHIYNNAAQKMDTLDLRRLTEITVNKSQDLAAFEYNNLASPKEPNQSIVLAFRDMFYLIQADTKADSDSWLGAIKRADCGSGPTLEDMQLTTDGIPIVVQKCLSYVERHGMDSRGIYRLSGTHSKTTQLLTSFQNNARQTQMIDNINVHDVSNTLKRWCKSLPGSILTGHLYAQWIEVAGSNQSTSEEKLERYRHLVKILPERHKLTLKAILQHLVRVSTFEQENDMTLHNLSIVFGPTLMSIDEKESGGTSFVGDTAKQIGCIEDLLVNFDALFEAPDSDHSWSDKSSRDEHSTDSDHDEEVYQNIDDMYNYVSDQLHRPK